MIKQQVHNANTFGLKPVIKAQDMDPEMFKEVEKLVFNTMDPKEKFKDEVEVANYIKEKLEDRYRDKDLCWHVIVGRNFGGFLTYQEKIYTYFYVGQFGYLIFATVNYFL